MVDRKPSGPIGVVTIAGMIVDGKAGPGTAGGDTIAKEIEDGIRNKGIKALVVSVDSPGGSVLASERIRQALLEAKAKKIPVVVSMGSVAASGGYWVSTPGRLHLCRAFDHHRLDRRVRSHCRASRERLQKLGIGADGVKTTPLSGEPDLLKGPSPEANQLIQTGVEFDVRPLPQHRRRVAAQDAAAGRPDRPGPRVGRRHGAPDWAGRRLRRDRRGDRQGGAAGHLGDERGVRYLEPAKSFSQQLIEALADAERTTTAQRRATPSRRWRAQPQQQLAGAISEVRSILAGPSIQARCLECPQVTPARLDKRDLTLLEVLKEWLF